MIHCSFYFVIVLGYTLRQAYEYTISATGITIEPRKGSRQPEVRIRDSSYADDIGLLSTSLSLAEDLLHSVETAALSVGLQLNTTKTELMTVNISGSVSVTSLSGKELKRVAQFKYLGSYLPNCFKDFQVRKAVAWD